MEEEEEGRFLVVHLYSTLADYNYDSVQSILIIFSKLFVNDHKSCLVVKFPPHSTYVATIHNALFCTNYTAYRKEMRHLSSVKRIVHPTFGRQTAGQSITAFAA